MASSSITEAARAIGIDRTTLIEQLDRLEADLGTPLSTALPRTGTPPTTRGKALLQALGRPDIAPLRSARTRLPRLPA